MNGALEALRERQQTEVHQLLERQERETMLTQAVDFVGSKIRKAEPGASDNVLGGVFDAYGSASWAPTRDPSINWSSWGRWEAWQYQKIEGCRLVVTGDWIAWDSGTGQQIGFSDKSRLSARQQAEMLAVLQNDGAPTRVVSLLGSRASSLEFEAVRKHVESRIDADTLAAMQGEAATRKES